ncbi:hypothetical protein ACKWTF_011055 [Chironomus riparius]
MSGNGCVNVVWIDAKKLLMFGTQSLWNFYKNSIRSIPDQKSHKIVNIDKVPHLNWCSLKLYTLCKSQQSSHTRHTRYPNVPFVSSFLDGLTHIPKIDKINKKI